jgi:hypothetical protein
LAGSFHGLVAFGRTTLGWRDGWEYLVPGTLDGVSVTFAMLAFRAVRKQKTPDRCYRVVWGAAIASATINFSYESSNPLAGGYVALLSLFGMVMFDEFLNQFEEGAASVRRENPKFGVRWLTWPTNTFLAAVAWRNHPPAEGTPGTVANAVANLNRVRAAKREGRRASPASRTAKIDVGRAPTDRNMREQESVGPGPAIGKRAAIPARGTRQLTASAARVGTGRDDDVRVPTTAATVVQWVRTWIAMCDRPEVTEVAVRDDDLAREQFGCTARQLRHVRYAVVTRALRRRAGELGVELPDRYDDSEAPAST